ncbi:GerMN domain-containing protein [Clostridium thailandense]|uniref:GerMN domain-containing protein n=1 Tax=Clostridium thailandense TaxID=2794346 RepID=A0A949TZ89_9CLOT|nr:GerMN domain-containing protein [Clostridium thailandense]MBV7273284.1 GerMN domain-containing protein [Clostridium thailandense]MCH5137309.1 GerMN domain-containing protein [Clostridiaceae bacterium UIB06]
MKKGFCLLICSLLTTSLLVITGCEKKDKTSLNSNEKEKKIILSKEDTLDLNIYFDSSSNTKNPEVAKEERIMKRYEILGEIIIGEIIKGPSVNSKLKPTLPKDTRILSFSIKDNIAFLNLSKEANISMTSYKEETCLKSIIWSLSQIPSVEKVKILIENKDIDLWDNHFDLSKPLGKGDIQNAKRD